MVELCGCSETKDICKFPLGSAYISSIGLGVMSCNSSGCAPDIDSTWRACEFEGAM